MGRRKMMEYIWVFMCGLSCGLWIATYAERRIQKVKDKVIAEQRDFIDKYLFPQIMGAPVYPDYLSPKKDNVVDFKKDKK